MHNTKLSSLIKIHSGKDYKHLNNGNVPVYGSGGLMCFVDKPISDHEDAIGIGRKGSIEKIHKLKYPFWTVDTLFWCTSKGYNLSYLKYLIETINLKRYDEGSTLPSLSSANIKKIPISIHSENVVEKISAKLSQIDNLILNNSNKINKLKVLVDFVLNEFIFNENSSEEQSLDQIASVIGGYAFDSNYFCDNMSNPKVIRIGDIVSSITEESFSGKYYSGKNTEVPTISPNQAIIALSGATFGKVGIVKSGTYCLNQRTAAIVGEKQPIINQVVKSKKFKFYIKSIPSASAQPNISNSDIKNFKFCLSKNALKVSIILSQMDNFIVVIFATSIFHIICIL